MLRVERLDASRHERSCFDYGTASLSDYLKLHAARHMEIGISATQILLDQHAFEAIFGYYSTVLLADAVSGALALRTELGLRVLIVDALDEKAAGFYRAFGFRDCTSAGRTLYLSLVAPRPVKKVETLQPTT